MDISLILTKLVNLGIDFGERILGAIAIYFIGRMIIKWLNKLFAHMLEKRKVDTSILLFLKSTLNITLLVLLGLAIIGSLGIELTGFAALLASAGVAIGMALSGNLQNFAGGLLILVFRPYKVGDYIESSTGASGTVKEIQIFHTVLCTPDNRVIYAPNGAMSSGVITNFNQMDLRRVDWSFGVEYGVDFQSVKKVITEVLKAENRVLQTPAPFIELGSLSASSVDITVRAWVKKEDYWDVNFAIRQAIYTTFNKEGINFPFPQLTVHQE